MNILVVGSEVPATASMPGSPRLFSLCRILARRHRLTLVTLDTGAERTQAFRDDPMTAGVFKEFTVLPAAPAPGWLGKQRHRLRFEANIVTRSRTPAYHAAQRQRILEIARAGRFDVILADGLPIAQYLVDAPLPAPAIIDLHDCFTMLFERTVRAEPSWLRKLSYYAESRSVARLERSLSRTFRCIITNSAIDEAFLQRLDPRARTLTIGNGVDSEFFAPSAVQANMAKAVFTGVMDYGPNEDAAVYFAESVLPLVQQRRPEMELWIVGKSPTERVRALERLPGVHVTGGVPDVRPFLQEAGIFVCPLRYGSGVKNKLLAALAMNRAVVATPLSLEGLELRDGEQLLVAAEAADFAARVVQLVEDPALASRLGAAGRAFVRERYSWETSAGELEAQLEQAIAAPGAGAAAPAGLGGAR